MAKRKRLSPARMGFLTEEADPAHAAPPIAQVASEASAISALEEVAEELTIARREGRLIQTLPLEAVDENYLVRDRMLAADEELEALMASLAARGQQTPIEVVDLGEVRYGLISGWRRLAALRRLWAETGEERFAKIQALLRAPETASDAYIAMVEENEIRVGLSYFERARIAVKAVEQGVFADKRAALQGLFAAASRARRSKIGSFMPVVAALDGVLRHPGAIPERLGLRLSKALEARPELAEELRTTLRTQAPTTLEEEQAALTAALTPQKPPAPALQDIAPGLKLQSKKQSLTLSGPAMTPDLAARLVAWLRREM